MKKHFYFTRTLKKATWFGYVLVFSLILMACKKEHLQDSPKAPVAIAGDDQRILLPIDSIILNGSFSYDPDGTITSYSWAMINGPGAVTFRNRTSAETIVKNLVSGVYHFELTVTDDGGHSSKDTLEITVDYAPGKVFIFEHLYWQDDRGSRQIHTALLQLPNGYPVHNITKVYFFSGFSGIFGGGPSSWEEIHKDGTNKGVTYYKIDSNSNGIIIYRYYNDPPAIIFFDFPFKLKIEFL